MGQLEDECGHNAEAISETEAELDSEDTMREVHNLLLEGPHSRLQGALQGSHTCPRVAGLNSLHQSAVSRMRRLSKIMSVIVVTSSVLISYLQLF